MLGGRKGSLRFQLKKLKKKRQSKFEGCKRDNERVEINKKEKH